MSEEALFSHESRRHFILNFRIYCTFQHDDAGILKCFCFIWKLWIRWGRYQLQFLNLPTASSSHAGGAILSLYDRLQPSVFKFCCIYILKTLKTVVQACKLLKSLSKKPCGSSKKIFIKLLFLFAWWGRWKLDLTVSQFFSLFLKILTEAGTFIILRIS